MADVIVSADEAFDGIFAAIESAPKPRVGHSVSMFLPVMSSQVFPKDEAFFALRAGMWPLRVWHVDASYMVSVGLVRFS